MFFEPEGKRKPKLSAFCEQFCIKHGNERIHDAELLALEFRRYFKLPLDLRLTELRELLEKKQIAEFKQDSLPEGNRGSYFRLEDRIIIKVNEDDWEGSQEFTIAHELREIVGDLARISLGFNESSLDELELEADAFAAALLMDSRAFREDAIKSGFDPIYLHEKYHKSYIGVVSRIASVLSHENHSPFWGTVLERQGNTPPGFFVSGCFHRTQPYLPLVRYTTPNLVFPKRGQLVPIRGCLKKAVDGCESVFINQLTELDFWDRYCLSVLIRPVIWQGRVVKLIIVAVPHEQTHKIQPQLYRVSPTIVEKAHQFIWEEV
jgi:Zn-dependent peptidase ImmA (M78 family)